MAISCDVTVMTHRIVHNKRMWLTEHRAVYGD